MGRRLIDKEIDEKIIQYLKSGKKYVDIAKKLMISLSYIYKVKTKNDIKIKDNRLKVNKINNNKK